MSRKTIVVLATTGLLAGCIVPGRRGPELILPGLRGVHVIPLPRLHLPHGHVVVAIPHGHVHSHHCGHYWYGGHWVHWAGHIHGPHCGHVWANGMWCRAE